ncbi:MAG TPA: hypothetical protein VGP93_15385 [Polyangiaceae bacterium]|jgi:hypothetical protein|nr:hypothetical protein [Polyangiaceae bacterium]
MVTGAVTLVAVASAFQLLLAPFAAVGVLLAFLAASHENARARRLHYLTLSVAALAASYGFVRFLSTKAIAGIVQGGTRAAEDQAISRLREVLFAEDTLRKQASVDPDGDAVGSAALIPELTGEIGVRKGARLMPPLLERFGKSESTAIGPAYLLGGYFFAVCLPVRGGGFSAEPEAAVDEEAAERRFLAYAWPSVPRLGLTHAYFLDEHERILLAPTGPKLRMGYADGPACDDAIAPATRADWGPWRKKRARDSLPGERATGR